MKRIVEKALQKKFNMRIHPNKKIIFVFIFSIKCKFERKTRMRSKTFIKLQVLSDINK
jgi:hypothetical protein